MQLVAGTGLWSVTDGEGYASLDSESDEVDVVDGIIPFELILAGWIWRVIGNLIVTKG
jgi:hypothetical protein